MNGPAWIFLVMFLAMLGLYLVVLHDHDLWRERALERWRTIESTRGALDELAVKHAALLLALRAMGITVRADAVDVTDLDEANGPADIRWGQR